MVDILHDVIKSLLRPCTVRFIKWPDDSICVSCVALIEFLALSLYLARWTDCAFAVSFSPGNSPANLLTTVCWKLLRKLEKPPEHLLYLLVHSFIPRSFIQTDRHTQSALQWIYRWNAEPARPGSKGREKSSNRPMERCRWCMKVIHDHIISTTSHVKRTSAFGPSCICIVIYLYDYDLLIRHLPLRHLDDPAVPLETSLATNWFNHIYPSFT